ncbi:uncharacterized protein si:ch211-57n23.1 [Boleophthalmus pectinirostris]|uniref:uncharacterized protein si:ch211-57n23.1 n=1 Tax=Boleophthalmus pectinirostris TaxID=150288 RepID=UPI00242ED090|nr:uncharacterized protein si:ch211-57n23.1 [Boleophthalmus pectinirostris]
MLWFSERAALLCVSCCLLIGLCCWADDTGLFPGEGSGDGDFEEWGSGSPFLHLLHSFPADSPFLTETPGKQANCTQRFVLPSAPSICWDHVAGPEEFSQSRLLLLQNRAALQALSDSSGVEEGGPSYELQAKDEVQGIHADHQSGNYANHGEGVFVFGGEEERRHRTGTPHEHEGAPHPHKNCHRRQTSCGIYPGKQIFGSGTNSIQHPTSNQQTCPITMSQLCVV